MDFELILNFTIIVVSKLRDCCIHVYFVIKGHGGGQGQGQCMMSSVLQIELQSCEFCMHQACLSMGQEF